MTGFGDVAGFVLVGGCSSRMGTDKAFINYRGLALAGYIANELKKVAGWVSLIGDPALYSKIGYPMVPDDYPGARFGLLIGRLRRLNLQCVVPVTPDGQEQVLCAAYWGDACAFLATALESGEAKSQTAVRGLRADYWQMESGEWAVNLNTREDWNVYTRQEA